MTTKLKFGGREYVKSSFSGTQHQCVGVSIDKEGVSLINTKAMDKTIFFSHDEWRAFIKGVKNNEFHLD